VAVQVIELSENIISDLLWPSWKAYLWRK